MLGLRTTSFAAARVLAGTFAGAFVFPDFGAGRMFDTSPRGLAGGVNARAGSSEVVVVAIVSDSGVTWVVDSGGGLIVVVGAVDVNPAGWAAALVVGLVVDGGSAVLLVVAVDSVSDASGLAASAASLVVLPRVSDSLTVAGLMMVADSSIVAVLTGMADSSIVADSLMVAGLMMVAVRRGWDHRWTY
jgi:hypothetical protein